VIRTRFGDLQRPLSELSDVLKTGIYRHAIHSMRFISSVCILVSACVSGALAGGLALYLSYLVPYPCLFRLLGMMLVDVFLEHFVYVLSFRHVLVASAVATMLTALSAGRVERNAMVLGAVRGVQGLNAAVCCAADVLVNGLLKCCNGDLPMARHRHRL